MLRVFFEMNFIELWKIMENPIPQKSKGKKIIPKEFFDDRLGRMPPNTRELEEAVLGAMM